MAHDLDDGFGEAGFERGLLIRLAVFDRSPEFDQLRRPDQAADMGGEDAIGVVRHGWVPDRRVGRREAPCPRGVRQTSLT